MASDTFTAVDLSKLPAPAVVEALEYEAVLADLIATTKVLMPDFVVRESDPAVKILEIVAYRELLLRQRVNDAARAVMVAYAEGDDLDNLGALMGVARLVLAAADEDAGTPATMESDEDFRRRIVLAPEGYSVAGPEGAYIYHALSADARMLDASATSPEPDDIRALVLDTLAAGGAAQALVAAMTAALDAAVWPGQVVVSALSREEDGTAPQDLVDAVAAYVSAEERRPLTDYVTVQSAEIISYRVVASLTTYAGPDGSVVLENARAGLAAYVGANHRLGRDITISGLHAALHVEGVQNVVLTEPAADIVLDRTQAAYCTETDISYAGVGE